MERVPGQGSILARSAGVSLFLYSFGKNCVFLKLSSGVIKKVSIFCVGTENEVSNPVHKFLSKKNAGSNRVLGFKSKVRGVVMNPVDHPHGGGEGKKSKLVFPKTPWGKILVGKKK